MWEFCIYSFKYKHKFTYVMLKLIVLYKNYSRQINQLNRKHAAYEKHIATLQNQESIDQLLLFLNQPPIFLKKPFFLGGGTSTWRFGSSAGFAAVLEAAVAAPSDAASPSSSLSTTSAAAALAASRHCIVPALFLQNLRVLLCSVFSIYYLPYK